MQHRSKPPEASVGGGLPAASAKAEAEALEPEAFDCHRSVVATQSTAQLVQEILTLQLEREHGGRIFQKLVPDEAAAPEPGRRDLALVWSRVDAAFVAA